MPVTGQLNIFGVEARPPSANDLEGLLAGTGQVVRLGGTARVSIVVDSAWRVRVLVAECRLRGLAASWEPAGEAGQYMVRTAYSAALAPLVTVWLRDGVQRAPEGFALDGRRLRLWLAASGAADGADAFTLRIGPGRSPASVATPVEADEAEGAGPADREVASAEGADGQVPAVVEGRSGRRRSGRKRGDPPGEADRDPATDSDAPDGDPGTEGGADADRPEAETGTPGADREIDDHTGYERIGSALSVLGLAPVLLGSRVGGPAYRIVGRRRVARLAELVGEPPPDSPPNGWPLIK